MMNKFQVSQGTSEKTVLRLAPEVAVMGLKGTHPLSNMSVVVATCAVLNKLRGQRELLLDHPFLSCFVDILYTVPLDLVNVASLQSTLTDFVSGVTGSQGGALCQELLKLGWNVRGLTRNPASTNAQALQASGVHLTHGDWDNDQVLSKAFAGCDKIYLCLLSNFKDFTEASKRARRVVELARAAGIQHAVISTTLGMSLLTQPPPIPPSPLFTRHLESRQGVEQAVVSGGFDQWTELRPSFFMANYLEPKINMGFTGIKNGVWTTCMTPKTQRGLVDHAEIRRIAAVALQSPGIYHGRKFGITSQHMLIQDLLDHIAEACSDGRSIKPIYLTDKKIAKLQAEQSKMLFVAEPRVRTMSDYVDMKEFNGLVPRGLTSFKDFLKREKSAVEAT